MNVCGRKYGRGGVVAAAHFALSLSPPSQSPSSPQSPPIPEMFRKSTPARPVPQPASITFQPWPFRLDGRRALPCGEARNASTALFLWCVYVFWWWVGKRGGGVDLGERGMTCGHGYIYVLHASIHIHARTHRRSCSSNIHMAGSYAQIYHNHYTPYTRTAGGVRGPCTPGRAARRRRSLSRNRRAVISSRGSPRPVSRPVVCGGGVDLCVGGGKGRGNGS